MKTVNKKYTIAVAGIGYVGLSNAVLLSQNHPVYAVDVVQAKRSEERRVGKEC